MDRKSIGIAVTGMGICSPVGNSVPVFWNALCEGRCGIRPLTRLDAERYRFRQAGEIMDLPDVLPGDGPAPEPAYRFVRAAAAEALGQAATEANASSDAAGPVGLILATLRPFDSRRNGTIFGEGAAVLLLEEEAVARGRGANLCARVLGSGFTNKSMTSHTMGAAGAMEAVASIMTLQTGIVPPTINLQEQDPACDLDVTPHRAASRPVATVLSNSAGIGGCNAALVFQRQEETNA